MNADHIDSHYCAAIFKYLHELAIKFRMHTSFVSQDDKHFVKVGEPGFPVAAVERGKQVVVSADAPFSVGDHDFTKAKIIPSVTLLCNVPEKITALGRYKLHSRVGYFNLPLHSDTVLSCCMHWSTVIFTLTPYCACTQMVVQTIAPTFSLSKLH